MKRIRRFFIGWLTAMAAFPLVTLPAYADVNICDYFPACQYFQKPSDLVNAILPAVMSIIGIVFFILVIISGFQIIMHAGSSDPKELAKWRGTLSAALVGFLIVVSAYWIVQIIQNTLHVRVPGF